ncbi:ATP synthase subunit f, mitochondrial-like [Ptychodera flava]|uniref:ATP synthase subunit f, mitochondrial-like n=1 Tax=Ptychodera flava TaxID=63121 RepID=UPI00396A5F05
MASKNLPAKLGEVKLGQLPTWLGTCSFSPKSIGNAIGRGHTRFVMKYVNVKRGSFAPIGMFIAMYFTVSYIWRYEETKHERTKVYHW